MQKNHECRRESLPFVWQKKKKWLKADFGPDWWYYLLKICQTLCCVNTRGKGFGLFPPNWRASVKQWSGLDPECQIACFSPSFHLCLTVSRQDTHATRCSQNACTANDTKYLSKVLLLLFGHTSILSYISSQDALISVKLAYYLTRRGMLQYHVFKYSLMLFLLFACVSLHLCQSFRCAAARFVWTFGSCAYKFSL